MVLVLVLVLALTLFIILGLLVNLRFTVEAMLRGGFLNIKITVRFFYMLIPLNFFLRIEYMPREGIRAIRILKNGRLKSLKKRKAAKETPDLRKSGSNENRIELQKDLVRAALASTVLRKIEISGEAGIKREPFFTVMLTGCIRIILDTYVKLFLFNAVGGCGNTVFHTSFFPCMTRNTFSLNMEGIAEINMPKLIKKAAAACLKFIKQNINNKGDIKNAPYRKHNADLGRAD